MPEGMCGQYLSHDFHVTKVTNHDDDDRQITRNALSPERSLTFGAAAKAPRRRSKLGLRKDDQAGQLLKGLHIGTPNVQPAHLKLGMGPCGFKSADTRVKFGIAARQCNNGFARICHHRDQRELKALVRQNRHAPAQAEYRIEHGTNTVRQATRERFRIFRRTTPAKKLGSGGLKFRRLDGRFWDHEMRDPDWTVVRTAKTAPSHKGFAIRQPLSFDEQLVESGMRAIR